MNQLIVKFAQKIGMDKAIAYSSGSRIVQGVAGVLTVFFVSTFLTGVEQGYYFTFGSILALQVFFELGLTGIMTQYVAHEASHLFLNDALVYEGDRKYVSRLASLIHFCFKWYLIVAVIVFVFLTIIGFVFFYRYGEKGQETEWRIPWLLVCLGTALKLFQSPFNSILLGLGKVKEMSQVGFWQQIIIPLSTWLGLILGFKLYVLGIGYILSVFVWQDYVQRNGLQRILLNLWKEHISEKVSYVKEIFPYQWRIALSWVSGYFIFQLFNPVLFATEGAIVAGQMGMTLHALTAILALSMSWIGTKIPEFSRLIALKNYVALDNKFKMTITQMSFVCFCLLLSFGFFIWILNYTQLSIKGSIIANRFLGYFPMILMMISFYCQMFVGAWATYLRCHKKEPFLLNSICAGIVSCFCTFVFGNLYGLYGITISYFLIEICFLPWGYWIFKTKKYEWHK